MTYQIIFTDTAKEDLWRLAVDIAQESGDKIIAKNFIEELRAACERLREYPESGSLPKDRLLKNAGYRFISHKQYLLFCKVNQTKQTVYLMTVFSSRMDYVRYMKRFI